MISPLRRGRQAGRLSLSLGTARRLLLLMIAVLATGSIFLRRRPHELHEHESALPQVQALTSGEHGGAHTHVAHRPPIAKTQHAQHAAAGTAAAGATTRAGVGAATRAGGARVRPGQAKEVIGNVEVDTAAVVAQLQIPRSEHWDTERLHRRVVNQAEPMNRFDEAHVEPASWMPDEDLPEGAHGSCAVVGNGGVNLLGKYGAAIDAHDAVFRFNDGPTDGWEAFVGSKTTYRLDKQQVNNAWSRSFQKKHPRGATEEALVLFGHGSTHAAMSLHHKWPAEHVYFMAPEFAASARGQYKKAYTLLEELGAITVAGRNSPPTGVEGIFFAVALCQKVHVYGFNVAEQLNPSVQYHYHDKVEGEIGAHSFNFQAIFLRMLAAEGHFALCVPGLATDECAMGV